MESENKACIVGAVPRIAVTSASRPCCLRNPIPDATHKGAKPRTLEEAATGNLTVSSAVAITGNANIKHISGNTFLRSIIASLQITLRSRANLTDPGQRDPDAAYDDERKNDKHDSECRNLRDPSAGPELPNHRRDYGIVPRVQRQRHGDLTVGKHADPNPAIEDTRGDQRENNFPEHSRRRCSRDFSRLF